jgi:hypothetical protein
MWWMPVGANLLEELHHIKMEIVDSSVTRRAGDCFGQVSISVYSKKSIHRYMLQYRGEYAWVAISLLN